MVMAGRSVHLTTLFFLGKLEQAVNQYFVHILSLVTDNNPSFCFVCLFDLILYVHSTIFQLCGTGLPGLNQY